MWYPGWSYWFHQPEYWDQASTFGDSRRKSWIPSFLKICRQAFTSRVSLHSPYAFWLDQIWGLTVMSNNSHLRNTKQNPLSTAPQEHSFSTPVWTEVCISHHSPRVVCSTSCTAAGAAHFTSPLLPEQGAVLKQIVRARGFSWCLVRLEQLTWYPLLFSLCRSQIWKPTVLLPQLSAVL